MFLLDDGIELPPTVALLDHYGRYWLADGFHRWHARKALQRESISVEATRPSHCCAGVWKPTAALDDQVRAFRTPGTQPPCR
jgi:hypothetical protein